MSSPVLSEKQNAFVSLLLKTASLSADAERASEKARATSVAYWSAHATVESLEKELQQARLDARAAAEASDKAAAAADAAHTASLQAIKNATTSVVKDFTPIPMRHAALIEAFTNAYTAYRDAESEETLAAFVKAAAELANALAVA